MQIISDHTFGVYFETLMPSHTLLDSNPITQPDFRDYNPLAFILGTIRGLKWQRSISPFLQRENTEKDRIFERSLSIYMYYRIIMNSVSPTPISYNARSRHSNIL